MRGSPFAVPPDRAAIPEYDEKGIGAGPWWIGVPIFVLVTLLIVWEAARV